MNKQRWIFLRGLTRGNIHWGNFPQVFSEKSSAVETEYLEIPGNGKSFEETTPLSPELVVEYLRSKSNFYHKNQTYHLCGISLGGMIALKWAEMYPKEVLSVTTINSSLAQGSFFYQRLRPKNYLNILFHLFFSGATIQEKIILQITSNRSLINSERYLESFSEFSTKHPVSKMNFFRQLILATKIKIKNANVPLTVISSTNDRLVNSSCSKIIANRFSAKEVIHPTAGHDLPLDEPEWLSETLVNATADQ